MFKYLYKGKKEHYYLLFIVTIFCVLINSILEVSQAFVFMIYMNRVIGLNDYSFLTLILIGAVYLILAIVFGLLSNYLVNKLLAKAKFNIEKDLLTSIENTSLADYKKNYNLSSNITNLYNKVERITSSFYYVLINILGLAFSFVIAFIYVSTLSLYFILIIAFVILVLILSIILSKKPLIKVQNKYFNQIKILNKAVTNFSFFINTAKIFSYQKTLIKNYNKEYDEFNEIQREANTFAENLKSLSTYLGLFLYIFMYIFATYLATINLLNGGEIVSIVQVTTNIITPFFSLTYFINQINSSKPILDEFKKRIETKEKGIIIDDFNNIKLNNISYSYEDKNIVNNFSLSLELRNITLLIGESGKGKTTTLNIISKQIEDYEGEILLDDNINLKDINDDSYFKKLKILEQTPAILNASIKENIILNSSYDEEKFFNILHLLKLDNRFNKENINEILNDENENFSLGEKRRIGLARILYSDPKFILLDEPFASLDKDNQEIIVDLLKNMNDKSILIVTHVYPESLENIVNNKIYL